MGTTVQKLQKIIDSKEALRQSIINKGMACDTNVPFDEYSVKVDNISTGITPSGSINITENGTTDVTNYASAIVNVASSGASLNIQYSLTEPADTTKMWVKIANEPTKVLIKDDLTLANENNSTLSATLATAASGLTCASVGTDIYIFGGSSGSNKYLNTIQKFNTLTNTITTLSATLAKAASYLTCASVGTDIYIFGGSYSSSNLLNTIQKFNTLTNTITTLSARLATAAYDLTCASVGTDIYIFGGNSSGNYLNTIQKFNTLTNTITTLSARLATAAYGLTCASVDTDIYIFGGNSSGNYLNTIQKFNTLTNTITTLSARLATAAFELTCASVGTDIYIFGGSNGNVYLNTIQKFVAVVLLTSNYLQLLVMYTGIHFSLLSSDSLELNVGFKECYLGNASNQGEEVEAYIHNGTSWVAI